ncbi:dihydroneopterin aldolase [Actinomarinicola tropica]|uniref:7,8-dihydroneopterin aldolase n=1 Tax=Actinomarinicola tropica TaxID=2789776 RepID=A0A5Q2RI80_9ACTN|nr:dihydroneopterin aldolase [Actinomarinicola tropica]QGG96499.1 dihydroneopterin aldolase [Actinomarinicola tropica]
MSDRIELRGLRAVGICGALPEEQERAQPFEIDLDVHLDLAPAGGSDRLDQTVDYGALGQTAVDIVTEGRFVLIERIAEVIAAAVLDDERVDAVEVVVRKVRPPVPFELTTSAVRILRRRGG